ncbi:hypothetical protein BZM26_37750 [Paraburkholderia strydomiana]|nr:hypothetical protein BZM26_37750 [Paraburkholderia strydomiana]
MSLRFPAQLQELLPAALPFVDLLQRFDGYLREERGVSSHTIYNRCWQVQASLCWLTEQASSVNEMQLEQVDTHFSLRRMQGWSLVSMASLAGAPRRFFR